VGDAPRELAEALRDPLSTALGARGLGRVELLMPAKDVADDPSKLLVRDAAGRRAAVLAVSPSIAPDLVARSQRGARAAREALGEALGAAVLLPLAEGQLEGRSWALLPWCRPVAEHGLAGWLARRRLAPALLAWLRAAAEATLARPRDDELEAGFAAPLRAALAFPELGEAPRAAAARGLERLQRGDWRPRFVLGHNDLWLGNVLMRGGGPFPALLRPDRFVLIDWPASRVRGHALFDLVRMASSFGVGPHRLHAEVAGHCRLLSCALEDAGSYLAAAIGHVGQHLEHMPPELFRQMASSCFAVLGET
jgi:hypothetical protein